MRRCLAALLAAAGLLSGAELISVEKIWDGAPHNAFTDLIRYKGQWYCTFREAQQHVSSDGALRVLESRDGRKWTSAALLTSRDADLRDPKITITPDGRLMLTTAGALHQPSAHRHQSMAWFSRDGRNWGEPAPIGDPDFWLWRVTWGKGKAYTVGYNTAGGAFARLYSSADGTHFETLVDRLFEEGFPNESSILFLPDGTGLCLLRRDKGSQTAQLGTAKAPYRDWIWKDLGARLGGPHMIRIPDGRIVAGGRLYDGKVRTALCWLDPDSGKLTEFLALPSGGDTSYPGLVWEKGVLWVSYYSSHEGKTSIYLAKVKL